MPDGTPTGSGSSLVAVPVTRVDAVRRALPAARPAGQQPVGAPGQRGDIQGLRAVAVLAVVLYHAGVPWLGGGYVGVDVFFVISGFLITGMLTRELARTGRVSFVGFYARRARRILPAAALVLVVTTLTCAALLPPLRMQSVVRDAEACAAFAGNYRFAAVGTNYLAGETAPSPFLHYWSLGVEEQFYLLWPALVLLGAVFARRRRWALALLLGLLTAGSFVLGWRWTGQSPPWAFFSLPSRAWELGVGGLAALLARRLRMPAVAGWVGLGLVVASVVGLNGTAHFPGVIALVPVAGAALVLLAGSSPSGAGTLLGLRPLVRIGDVSYSWYLWHWPALVLAPVVVGHPLTLPWRLTAAAGSLALAGLTLVLVENPIRFARPIRPPRRALAIAAALVVTSVAVPAAAGHLVPDPIRGHQAAQQVTLQAPHAPPTASAPVPAEIATLEAAQRALRDQLATAIGTEAVPSNLQPPLEDAYNDSAQPFNDGCDLNYTDIQQGDCTYTQGARTVVLFGDSHAAQWFPALQEIAGPGGWRLQSFSKTLCPPLRLSEISPYLGRAYTECDQWRAAMFQRIENEHPALVILGASRRYGQDFGFRMYGPQWDQALGAAVGELRAAGSRVLVVGPVPDPHGNVPDCLSAHPDDAQACTVARSAGIDAAGAAGERDAVLAAGGAYVDIAPWLCTDQRCPAIVGPMLVYRDDNHLTTTYVRWLEPLMQDVIDAVMAGDQLPAS